MKYRKILNFVLILMVFVSWGKLSFFKADSFMNAQSLGSLKYFTILSNIFEAIASVVWLIKGNEKLKYAASVAVGLTFFTVVFFLGRLFGYVSMFAGPSFFLHGVIPLLSMWEMIFLCKEKMTVGDNISACLSMIIYGIFYLGNNIINGIGSWPDTNDWYGFLTWGYPLGFVIYFIMVAAIYLIGLMIRKLMDLVQKKSNKHLTQGF